MSKPKLTKKQTMSPNWRKDGERYRLHCGQITAVCSPTLPVAGQRWLYRVETNGGFGNLVWCTYAKTLKTAKAKCEERIRGIMDDIRKGIGE